MTPTRIAAFAAAALAAASFATLVATRHRPRGPVDAGELPVRQAPTTMPAAIARPVWRPVAGDSLGAATDFTRLGDTLVVLDRSNHRVALLRAGDDAWHVVGSVGRRGGGPGEFQHPMAIAGAGGDTIAVLEQGGRLQLFTSDGRLVRAEPAVPPCLLLLPALAYAADGTRWVSGNCAGTGAARDTMFAMLFRAAPGGEYAEVARVARMTLDLSWGTTFATFHPLADAGDVAAFGVGLDACVHLLASPDHAHAPSPRCDLAPERLTADPPAELDAMRREARRTGNRQLERALRWDGTLPVYWALLASGDALTLARPYSADSLALVPAGRRFDARDATLVAPLRGLVACVRGACLWSERESGRLALHDASGADAAGRSPPP